MKEDKHLSIVNWHKKRFPDATKQEMLYKLREECLELVEAIENNGNLFEKMGDVGIWLKVISARNYNVSAGSCIKSKFSKVLRKYGK